MSGPNGTTPGVSNPIEAPHLYVGTPCHDNRWHVMMAMSMIQLVGSRRMSITTNKCSGGGIHKARNNIAFEFLKSGRKKLMWIDSDISFTPEQIFRLWDLNLPIVGCPYTHKKPVDPLTKQPAWSARAIDGMTPDPRTGLQEVAAIGTGFLMIDRKVFTDIIARFGHEIGYIEDWNEGTGEHKFDFYKEGVVDDKAFGWVGPTFVTEDFYFCYMARKCGYNIMIDCSSYVNHWEGSRCYPEPGVVTPTAPPRPALPDHVQETDILNFAR